MKHPVRTDLFLLFQQKLKQQIFVDLHYQSMLKLKVHVMVLLQKSLYYYDLMIIYQMYQYHLLCSK